MADNINLDGYADISDCIDGMDVLDVEALREKTQEEAHMSAENARTYTHHCYDIIARYENEPECRHAEDLSGDTTYTAENWQEAMTAWAFNVAYAYIGVKMEEAVTEISDAADTLTDALRAVAPLPSDLPEDFDSDAIRVSRDCPHGWAVHAREDADGVHYWEPGELEGCKAIAVKAGGIWLSYTWIPAASASRTPSALPPATTTEES